MEKVISVTELIEQLASNEAPTLFDVRRKTDYDSLPKQIGGATWRDPEKTAEWVKELPVEQPVVVYCVKGGSVSQSVVEHLQREGYQASYLEGGIKAWLESGQKVEGH
jgi:rhodanese-related sulfurtransferase